MIFAYQLVSFILWPVFWGLVLWRRVTGRDLASAWRQRIGYAPKLNGPVVWCHAASVGEVASLLPLLHNLLQKRPDLYILVSTVTQTGAQALQAAQLPRTTHCYAPLDHPCWVARFFKRVQPVTALFIEQELWPNLIMGARKATQNRTCLLNARLSNRSTKRWRSGAFFLRQLLQNFAYKTAQSVADSLRFKSLGIEDMGVIGNLKHMRAALPADETLLQHWQTILAGKKLVVFASTHEGEEAMAINLHTALKKTHADLACVIIPRHAERAEKIILPAEHSDLHLVGAMGVLGVFYRLAHVAVIGNSFQTQPGGGHNPFEAVQLGCPVLFGPDMSSFADMAEDLLLRGCAYQVPDAHMLELVLDTLLQGVTERELMASACEHAANTHTHELERLLQDVLKYIPSC